MSSNNSQLKTIFLDTNALSRLSIYLEFCDKYELNPKDATINLEKGSPFWDKIGYPSHVFAVKKGIEDGQKLYSYLKDDSQEIGETVTSQVCEFELLHVLEERKADSVLREAGIPYRLRRKNIGKLFLSDLNEYDYKEVAQDLENFKTLLSDQEIGYTILEGEENARDIYKIAGVISGYILLDTMDIYVYASAILAESDELITYDRELKRVLKDLRESKDAFWKRIRKGLLEDLKETVPQFRDLDEVILPLGKKI